MLDHDMLKRLNDSFQSGNTHEIGRLAGELLAQNAENTVNLRRLSLALASMAYAASDLNKRMPVIIALAGLNEKQQPLHIEYCCDREEIAAKLGEEGSWPELLSLLRSSLLRWQPDTESQADLAWLTKCFSKAKEKCRSLKATLNFKLSSEDTFQTGSHSYMNILLVETLAAGADAWHRCLRGPGGVNFCLDNLWVFAEHDLADELIYLLTQDPMAYAALVNEINETKVGENKNEMKLNEGLKNILQPESLLQAVHTSKFCLAILSPNTTS